MNKPKSIQAAALESGKADKATRDGKDRARNRSGSTACQEAHVIQGADGRILTNEEKVLTRGSSECRN